ncbi:protein IRON-RELATED TRANSCRIPTION FACTOR 3-like isoform X1 [Primulina tabacum]|uniref:protein IRON-RELATED TRANSCRIPTION FACTOR 3-like isoform X1 n=1 Tax=Primulina tabacum TaxID=48773 RepID=UPI003F597DA4
MDSTGDSVSDRVNVTTRLCPRKKNPDKVPRKNHKAEREKLKRDHMNDLFVDLSKALDLNHPSNGKASMLRETVRLLGELLAQVDHLKKENDALLSESNYVTIEKNELLEENSALDAQIKKLQSEIDERENSSNSDYSRPQSNGLTPASEDQVAMPLLHNSSDSTTVLGPIYVMPLRTDSQLYPSPYSETNTSMVSSVSRPQPRYPSSSDSWPLHTLTKQANVSEDI